MGHDRWWTARPDGWGEPPEAAAGRVVAATRFELIPLRGALELALAALPGGATVTVTASPVRGLEPTIELAVDLAGHGFDAVPHLAARSVRDRGHLADLLARLDAAGVRAAFVVGGDAGEHGAYPDGISLLRAMEELGHRFEELGVPAYPEGHVRIPDDVLLDALLAKQAHVSSMTTQLCFHGNAIGRWIRAARRAGVTLPLLIGMPGPVDLARLLRISARVGVASSTRYLRKNPGLVGEALRRRSFRPDVLLDEIGAVVADPAADVRGLHLFTFNQVGASAAWWETHRDAEGLAGAF
jgi:methylenetetrahydrofolate reductase (NADPH)